MGSGGVRSTCPCPSQPCRSHPPQHSIQLFTSLNLFNSTFQNKPFIHPSDHLAISPSTVFSYLHTTQTHWLSGLLFIREGSQATLRISIYQLQSVSVGFSTGKVYSTFVPAGRWICRGLNTNAALKMCGLGQQTSSLKVHPLLLFSL